MGMEDDFCRMMSMMKDHRVHQELFAAGVEREVL